MTIDPEQAATYLGAIIIVQVGVAYLYDRIFSRRNGGSFKDILKAIQNNGKHCNLHAPLEGRLNRLEEEHEEDTLQDSIKAAVKIGVKEAFKENGK